MPESAPASAAAVVADSPAAAFPATAGRLIPSSVTTSASPVKPIAPEKPALIPWTRTLIKGIKTLQSIGFTLSETGPIAAAYVAGSLDDARQRELLAAKLDEIEDRQRRLAEMSEFLRAKLDDLKATRRHECHSQEP